MAPNAFLRVVCISITDDEVSGRLSVLNNHYFGYNIPSGSDSDLICNVSSKNELAVAPADLNLLKVSSHAGSKVLQEVTCSLVPNIQVISLDVTIESSSIIFIQEADGASTVVSQEDIQQHATSHILNHICMRCSLSQVCQQKSSLCISLVVRSLWGWLFGGIVPIVVAVVEEAINWTIRHERKLIISVLVTVEVIISPLPTVGLAISPISAVSIIIIVSTVWERRKCMFLRGQSVVCILGEWAAIVITVCRIFLMLVVIGQDLY